MTSALRRAETLFIRREKIKQALGGLGIDAIVRYILLIRAFPHFSNEKVILICIELLLKSKYFSKS